MSVLEQAVIALLAHYGKTANSQSDAPGVYIDGNKIASLGLRIRRGCSYHGLSLNVDMDLAPFEPHQSLWIPRIADDPAA